MNEFNEIRWNSTSEIGQASDFLSLFSENHPNHGNNSNGLFANFTTDNNVINFVPPPVVPVVSSEQPIVERSSAIIEHPPALPSLQAEDKRPRIINWDKHIPDPVRRAKIRRWKEKRERYIRGLTKKKVYDVRVKYARDRPRIGGRFAQEIKSEEKQTDGDADTEQSFS